MKAVVFFLAIATALPSTAAVASNVRQQSDFRVSFAEPVERKAGCTGCACCDFITIAGIKIPVVGTGPVKPRGTID